MDFYSLNAVGDWTYVKVTEHYRAKLQKDQRQVLDSIKKDLQKVVLDFEFDETKRKKAQEILDQWKCKLGLLATSYELLVRRLVQAESLSLRIALGLILLIPYIKYLKNWTVQKPKLECSSTASDVHLQVNKLNQLNNLTGDFATQNIDNRRVSSRNHHCDDQEEKRNTKPTSSVDGSVGDLNGDQVAEIDGIIVNKEIWTKVMERLKKEKLRVQSIESRIVDLSNWTQVEWNRILKVSDYSQLFIKSRKKLCKEKIDKNMQQLLHDESGRIRSLNDLESWKNIFTNLASSEDSRLTVGIIHLCLRREINVLIMQHRERDFIVKILGPIIGMLLEEFDIGTFELNWIEKKSRSVTNRKRKASLLPLEVGNTGEPIDDTKYRKDHSKLKVVMKDCLDTLWSKLHFKKAELEEVFIIGTQITGTRWTIYSLSYDSSQNFYFFVEMATLILPTTFSDMEDLLPSFLENLLALRHTLIDLATKIRKIARKRLNTPSPQSSPLHETTNTPEVKKQKQDPFWILDDLY
ncbi:10630_t:CDS:10 [Dentiscutata erythropus]|uniref:10630_t:CDS:1 n=1 Tax=Dentiscutata erythropus TaxID=1348616 RepID=A0A9N9DCB0_9GLOM|nr:10630_t:CDS:10 [Dentiscutata erythropus]